MIFFYALDNFLINEEINKCTKIDSENQKYQKDYLSMSLKSCYF